MEENIKTLLLELLISEEGNVETTEREVERYQSAVEHHKNSVQRIHAALSVLGIESQDSK